MAPMKDQAVPDESGLWKEHLSGSLYSVTWNRESKCWHLNQVQPPRGFVTEIEPEAFPVFIIKMGWRRVRKDPDSTYYKRRHANGN